MTLNLILRKENNYGKMIKTEDKCNLLNGLLVLLFAVSVSAKSEVVDSLYIRNVEELYRYNETAINTLCLDFSLPGKIDEERLPKHVKKIRILKNGSIQSGYDILNICADSISLIELNGTFVELLPEALHKAKNLKTVVVSSANSATIWSEQIQFYNTGSLRVNNLVLKNCSYHNPEQMYENILFTNSRLTCDTLKLIDAKRSIDKNIEKFDPLFDYSVLQYCRNGSCELVVSGVLPKSLRYRKVVPSVFMMLFYSIFG